MGSDSVVSAKSTHSDGLRHEIGIFGTDTRSVAYDQPMFTAIQPLVTANGGTCTAILLSRRFAITAAHCAESGRPRYLRIDRQDHWGETIPIADSWTARNYQTFIDEFGREFLLEDFAILKLEVLAPADLACLEIATPQDVATGRDAMSVGYPEHKFDTKVRVKDESCTIHSLSRDIIRSNCATSKGSSGGPLLVKTESGQWKIAGLSSTQYLYRNGDMVVGEDYSDEKANYFTNLTLYFDRVIKTMRPNPTIEQ
jgi:protease YdgD